MWLKQLPTLKDIECRIDKAVAGHYGEFVGAARLADLEKRNVPKPWPMPARAKELHALFDYYERTYGLSACARMTANRIGYGLLAVALLGCGECWRLFLSLPDTPRERNREAFVRILRAYVPQPILARHENDFKKMAACVRRALEDVGVMQTGGTADEKLAFAKGVSREKPVDRLMQMGIK